MPQPTRQWGLHLFLHVRGLIKFVDLNPKFWIKINTMPALYGLIVLIVGVLTNMTQVLQQVHHEIVDEFYTQPTFISQGSPNCVCEPFKAYLNHTKEEDLNG